jgi:hypothetical protein
VTPAKDLADCAAVRQWIAGLTEQWGDAPADMDARIGTLRAFCETVGKEPDEMIAECTREVEGGKRIRIKGRRFYSEQIEEFQSKAEGDQRARARAGNIIRSFFIHNGIFMQAGLGRGEQ